MRRNTLVLGAVLFILATFAWAGWANFEYRRQAAERVLAATTESAELIDTSGDVPQLTSNLKGKPAPAFQLEDLAGHKVSLASYKGKAVLINFWATWCAPCKIETPWLVDLRNQYASQGFEILGLTTDDFDPDEPAKFTKEKADVAKFVEKMHMQYPILVAGDKLDHPYGGLDVLPESFFVNRKGTIVAVQLGLTSKDDIEANIKKALGQ